MDEDLKRVIRRLRSERCPPGVMDRVKRSIEGRREGEGRWGILSWSLATAAVLLGLIWAAAPYFRPVPAPQLVEAPTIGVDPSGDNERAALEAYASLSSVGLALREAGSRSGAIILQETLPLMRQGLETTRNAINSQREL